MMMERNGFSTLPANDLGLPVNGFQNMKKSAGVLVRLFLLLILSYSGIVLSNDERNKKIQSATIDVRLKFEGKDLMLTFLPNPNDAVQMASQFCYQQVPIDRIEERKECIRLVGQYLLEEVKKNNAMKQSRPQLEPSTAKSKDTISQIQMNIQGKIYDFEINTAVETTYDVAKRFCEANHQSFNILKTDVEKFCVIPIKTQMDSTMIKNSHASSVSSEERNSKEIKVIESFLFNTHLIFSL
jgi:hypothetical protein